MNKSIYFPEDSKTKEILKRVNAWMDLRKKAFGQKISFSEAVLLGLEKLVTVNKK